METQLRSGLEFKFQPVRGINEPAGLLVPLVSWAAPAHVPEGYLLKGSIRQCWQRLGWRPDIVVGDLGYIQQ